MADKYPCLLIRSLQPSSFVHQLIYLPQVFGPSFICPQFKEIPLPDHLSDFTCYIRCCLSSNS